MKLHRDHVLFTTRNSRGSGFMVLPHAKEVVSLKVRTGLKAGSLTNNHNEQSTGKLKVATHVRAGALTSNHNTTMR